MDYIIIIWSVIKFKILLFVEENHSRSQTYQIRKEKKNFRPKSKIFMSHHLPFTIASTDMIKNEMRSKCKYIIAIGITACALQSMRSAFIFDCIVKCVKNCALKLKYGSFRFNHAFDALKIPNFHLSLASFNQIIR